MEGKGRIFVFELQYDDWNHVDCNRGFLQNLLEVTDAPVYFVSDKRHYEHILQVSSHIEDKKRADLSRIISIPVAIFDLYVPMGMEHKAYYLDLVATIFRDYDLHKEDRLFFLSAPNSIMYAVSQIECEAKTFLMFHHDLEKMLLEEETGDIVQIGRQCIRDLICRKNIHFMAYSPYAKVAFEQMFQCKDFGRFYFVPLENWNYVQVKRKAPKRRIGVYGAAAFNGIGKVLKEMEKQKLLAHCEVTICRRTSLNGLDYKYLYPSSVSVIQRLNGFTRAEMQELHKDMDWILLPYPPDTYRYFASGILMDAIRLGIPIIALRNPYVDYYHSLGEIGIVEDTPEQLVSRMKEELLSDDKELEVRYDTYRNNMKIIRGISWQEAVKQLGECVKL